MKVLDIKSFRNSNKITQKELANFLGVSNAFISQIEVGEREMPEAQLSKILLNTLGWDTSMIWVEREEKRPVKAEPGKKVKLIPLLPFSAVAGYMSSNNGVDAFRDGELVAFPDFTDRGADCAIRVDGNSMHPRYNNGDILAIRIIHDPTFFQWGRVYVLSTIQGCIVKRLFPDPENEGKIICHSENFLEYPDYKIDRDEILAVAVVVGHAGVE